MSLEARFAAALDRCAPGLTNFGVAVSGGSDSLAVLHLSGAVAAATVDHGLRAEAADEADYVAQQCNALKIKHETLRWTGWDQQGNVQAEARTARYRLLADWARSAGLQAVLLGHTEDDIAETFLMRLGRKSGIGGLSAMAERFTREGMVFVRPACGFSRAELRVYLEEKGIDWIEDPSNSDPAFDRVRTRQTLTQLQPLGLDAADIAASARALGQVKRAIVHYTHLEAQQRVTQDRGDLIFDLSGALPSEIQRRLLAAGVHWFGRGPFPPRGATMARLETALGETAPFCVAGVRCQRQQDETVRMTREENAVRGVEASVGQIWDGRWTITGPQQAGHHVAALGSAIAERPDWRQSGLPHPSVLASPAVFKGDILVSAPVLDENSSWHAQIDTPFLEFLLSH